MNSHLCIYLQVSSYAINSINLILDPYKVSYKILGMGINKKIVYNKKTKQIEKVHKNKCRYTNIVHKLN